MGTVREQEDYAKLQMESNSSVVLLLKQ